MTRAATVLAFDFGLKRIGLACGDTVTRNAAPLAALTCGARGPDWEAIARAVRTHAPGVLVVGRPYNVDGSDSAISSAAQRFASELAARFALPVHLVDERYSSLEAEGALRERRSSGLHRRRVRRSDVDSAAAAVILGRWFAGEGEREGAR